MCCGSCRHQVSRHSAQYSLLPAALRCCFEPWCLSPDRPGPSTSSCLDASRPGHQHLTVTCIAPARVAQACHLYHPIQALSAWAPSPFLHGVQQHQGMGLASDASMQDPSSSSGVSMYHSSDTSSPGYPLGYSPWYWAMPVSPTAFPVAGPLGEHLPGQKAVAHARVREPGLRSDVAQHPVRPRTVVAASSVSRDCAQHPDFRQNWCFAQCCLGPDLVCFAHACAMQAPDPVLEICAIRDLVSERFSSPPACQEAGRCARLRICVRLLLPPHGLYRPAGVHCWLPSGHPPGLSMLPRADKQTHVQQELALAVQAAPTGLAATPPRTAMTATTCTCSAHRQQPTRLLQRPACRGSACSRTTSRCPHTLSRQPGQKHHCPILRASIFSSARHELHFSTCGPALAMHTTFSSLSGKSLQACPHVPSVHHCMPSPQGRVGPQASSCLQGCLLEPGTAPFA